MASKARCSEGGDRALSSLPDSLRSCSFLHLMHIYWSLNGRYCSRHWGWVALLEFIFYYEVETINKHSRKFACDVRRKV